MLNLINQGVIPRDVDVSPAFQRGQPALTHQPSEIFQLVEPAKPKQLRVQIKKPKIKLLQRRIDPNAMQVPDIDEPDATLNRDKTFLTSMDVSGLKMFESFELKKLRDEKAIPEDENEKVDSKRGSIMSRFSVDIKDIEQTQSLFKQEIKKSDINVNINIELLQDHLDEKTEETKEPVPEPEESKEKKSLTSAKNSPSQTLSVQ